MINPAPVLLRTGALAFFATTLAAAGHVAGGGTGPSRSAAVVVSALSWVLAAAGSRREWTFGGLLVVFGAAQVFAHLVFSGGTVRPGPLGSAAMATAHLAACFATAALIADADRLWRRFAGLLAATAALVRGSWSDLTEPAAPDGPAAVAARPLVPGRTVALVFDAPRRGPPGTPG